jgi:hypothetical protein
VELIEPGLFQKVEIKKARSAIERIQGGSSEPPKPGCSGTRIS